MYEFINIFNSFQYAQRLLDGLDPRILHSFFLYIVSCFLDLHIHYIRFGYSILLVDILTDTVQIKIYSYQN